MFSGTVFVRRREPDPDLMLPRSCWAVYDRLDGETSIGQIADTLGLSAPEIFAVVRQLQQRDLIEEPTITYAAYKQQEGSDDQNTEGEETSSLADASRNGVGSRNGTASAAEETTDDETDVIHLPTLWDWLEETTDNVKSYKNTQAFILMEASEALESIGVGNMDELEDLEQCSNPDVVEALEEAIENNVNEHIPDQCYR